MEKDWNKKRIEALLSGDEDAWETFIHDFGPVIYTWMYYQVGADEQMATELTGRTFGQAIRNISDFNPAEQTFFGQLKEYARQVRDEGLEQRQMKPQQPWAWSQLPDHVLGGLALLRSESLQEKTIDNPFVHEIIQATLAELDHADRELLIHRYNHLDTLEHISEEMNCPVEEVQSRLYRCRHSFRRVFFQLISKANSGFSESNAAGEIDTLDTNLEKLLSTTASYQILDDTKINAIRRNILEAVREIGPLHPERPAKKPYLPAAIAVAVIILTAGLYRITRNQGDESPAVKTPVETTTAKEIPTKKTDSEAPKTSKPDFDEEELKRVFALGQEGNLEALLEILRSGEFMSQATAAYFIGKLGDPSTIPLLEQAEGQWYSEPSNDNPFAMAITEILDRFPEAASVTSPLDSEPNEIPPVKGTPLPAAIPIAMGTVSNLLNQPIANVVLERSENTLFSNKKTGRKIDSIQTNPDGRYEFTAAYEGPAYLTAKIQAGDTRSITRPVWCKKDSVCIANFGGKPVLTGMVFVDGIALSNQTVYLSDTLDIDYASFGQEVVTDSVGRFSFSGVPAGPYHLLNKGFDNQVRRLAMIEMPEQEMYNADINLETASVSTAYPSDPNTAVATEAVLAYGMGIPDNLSQIQAVIETDGSILFKNVLPGTYLLKVRLDSGVWIQQNVDVTGGPDEQFIPLAPVPEKTAILTGRFLGASPVNLFLTNANQQLHIDIAPNADGSYELVNIPADVYSLATFVKGQLFEFIQVDLQYEPEMALDIDPTEILESFSPLYVVVADKTGFILSESQVWLNQQSDIITASSTGRGAFLAAPSGDYTLSAAHPGFPTQNLEINLKPSSLLAEPNADNTILVQPGTNGP
jgi:DNA-directed RNA polymerase specialized sigma24 family protein